jgi:hypothetical protein
MEQQASRLSMSLGVGKLTDARLSRALLSFMLEGVRFAFEGNPNEEDDLVLGSRLPFLLVLSKYSSWIKKNKGQLEILKDGLLANEAALGSHPEFDQVHEDDLNSLKMFMESLGISDSRRRVAESSYTQDDYSVADDPTNTIAIPSPIAASTSSRRRISGASSQRSRMSTQSNLSPLYEEDAAPDNEEREISPSPQKRRRLAGSLRDQSQTPIDEEDEDQGSYSQTPIDEGDEDQGSDSDSNDS